MGITVSFDLNYRAKLWTENIPEKQGIMRELMNYVDICFGNARDAALVLGYEEAGMDFISGDYEDCVDEEHMQRVRRRYGFTYLISSLRESISASDNGYGAEAAGDFGLYRGKRYMVHIVDRVGSGDAFAAGSSMGSRRAGHLSGRWNLPRHRRTQHRYPEISIMPGQHEI